MENTLYFYHPEGVTANRLKAVTEGVANWWQTELKPYQMNNVYFFEAFGRDLTYEVSYQYNDTRYAGQAGGYVSGSPLPANCTFSLCFRTGTIGRCYRGRNYLVGLSTQMMDGQSIGITMVGNWVAAYEELLFPSSYLGAYWNWSVVSRFYDYQPREVGVTTPITAVIAHDLFIDSMRRRLTGRGT